MEDLYKSVEKIHTPDVENPGSANPRHQQLPEKRITAIPASYRLFGILASHRNAVVLTDRSQRKTFDFLRGNDIGTVHLHEAPAWQQALLGFRQSLLDAGTEVNDALIQWQTARRRLTLDAQQIAALESAVRNSELLMRHSSQNYLKVLTARQTLLQAELDATSDRFDEIQGVVNLYLALGGGY